MPGRLDGDTDFNHSFNLLIPLCFSVKLFVNLCEIKHDNGVIFMYLGSIDYTNKNILLNQDSPYQLTPFRVVLVALVLGMCGAAVIPFLSIQLNPPPRSHGLQISYQLPDSSPERIESGITAPMERIMASIEGLTSIESRSSDGRGQITMQFSDRYDIGNKRLEVSARIRQLYDQFPSGTSYPVIHYRSEFQTEQRLLTFAFNSSVPASDLNNYLTRNLLPDIY